MQHAPGAETAKLPGGTGARDQFAHDGAEHAAAHHFELRAYFGELQADTAHRDVGIGAGVDFRYVDHGYQLARQQGFPARVLGEARRIADGVDIRAGQIAVELGVGAAAQDDHPIGAARVRQRVPEAGAHRQHRDQYRDHARDSDDDDAGGAEALWQGLQAYPDDCE